MSNDTALERDLADPGDGDHTPAAPAPGRGSRLGRLLAAHPGLIALLVAGAAVRVAVTIAYGPAFGYYADTGGYLSAAKTMVPSVTWPFGYSLFLKCLMFTGHIVSVALVQHLLGLAMGVGIYALLARRGVPGRWCAVAAAPVLLDAREIVLEHYVLSETLFTTLLLAGLVLLLWRARPSALMCALAGLVLAAAALTRTMGQPLMALVLVYLLVRRIGWRRVTAFVVSGLLPLLAYVIWYHHYYGVYSFNQASGLYLWQRTTTFVNCSRPDFTAEERKICPPEPLGQRPVNDIYLWGMDPHRLRDRLPDVKDDPIFASFGRKAILGQPVDFVKTIARDGIHLFQPGWQAPARIACTTDLWSMPSGDRASGQLTSRCKPLVLGDDFIANVSSANTSGYAAPTITALNGALWAYGRTFLFAPFAMLLMALFALVTACWRPRSLRPRDALDATLLVAIGAASILMTLVLSVIDLRFTVPLLTIVPPAAVLAWHRLRSGRTTVGDDVH